MKGRRKFFWFFLVVLLLHQFLYILQSWLPIGKQLPMVFKSWSMFWDFGKVIHFKGICFQIEKLFCFPLICNVLIIRCSYHMGSCCRSLSILTFAIWSFILRRWMSEAGSFAWGRVFDYSNRVCIEGQFPFSVRIERVYAALCALEPAIEILL